MQTKLATFLCVVVFSTASALAADSAAAGVLSPPLQLNLSHSLDRGVYALTLSGERRRNNAVAMARSNRLVPAVRVLTALHENSPADNQILFDLLSVLSWQGSHTQVTQLADSLEPDETPVYVLEAVASSARKSANYSRAIDLYTIALRREADNTALITGLAFSQADAGQAAAALESYALLPAAYRSSVDGMLADAYLARTVGDRPRALMAYNRLLAAQPQNSEALRGKFLVLRDLLLAEQALDFAALHPGIATRKEIDALHVDKAALWVRWGAEPVMPGPMRFADLDRALDLLKTNLQRYPADTALGRVTRLDRIAALHARGHHAEVFVAYEKLDLADTDLPNYVLRAVAGSRLALREPEEALRLNDIALQREPTDFQLNLDRFFTLVELERHAEARELTNELVFSQDIWRTVPGSRVVKPNPLRLKAEITRALSHAYADDLVAAQFELQDMLTEAPHNTDVRQELGSVYRWRGWPRRALFEYRQVISVEDDLLSARVGLANTFLDLGMGNEFEALLVPLQDAHGDNAGVKRLVRRHDLYHRNEMSAGASGGTSTGEQFGSRQHQAEARLSLGGFGYHWRPFILLHDSSAEFSEGTARRRRAGIGVQYRLPDHTLEAAVSSSVEGESRPGVAIAYGWDVDDRWHLHSLLETESHSLPLRAYRAGISADRIRIGAIFRHSELGELRAAAEAMDFSDGNLRQALLLEARRRLLNHPRFKFDLTAGIFASSNDLTDGAYFSPSSDRSMNLGGDARWRVFRRYERNFDQQLIVNVGRYSQSGFDADSIGSIELRQVLQLSGALELFLGVRRARALYDGSLEYGTFYQGGLRGRF